MADWPPGISRGDFGIDTFAVWSECGPNALDSGGLAGTAWPSANAAILVPVVIPAPAVVYQMACGTGTGTTGNFDLGIYDAAGNLMISTGSTAKTTASSERIVDVTDTSLLPGLYYLAMATDGTTNYQGMAPSNLGMCKLIGMRQVASAFALPSTLTLATMANAYIPAIGAFLRAD